MHTSVQCPECFQQIKTPRKGCITEALMAVLMDRGNVEHDEVMAALEDLEFYSDISGLLDDIEDTIVQRRADDDFSELEEEVE